MDFSEVKLIASDMDGTLLDPQHRISPDFFPVFEALKAKGILFAAASGRQYQNLRNLLSPIKDQIIFLAENGSFAAYQGLEILVQAMPLETVQRLIFKARKILGVYIVLCGKKSAYIESTAPEFMEQMHLYYDEIEVVKDLMQVTHDQILKIALLDLAGAETNSNAYFQEERGELQVTVSSKIWLDLSHLKANKGEALQAVQRKFGIPSEQTMVFGDYLNDLKMMGHARFSYAMENAHADVKAIAKFMAKSNSQNGVVEVLQQVVAQLG